MSKPGFRGACDDAVREDGMTRSHVSDMIGAPIEHFCTFSRTFRAKVEYPAQ
jgi:hypothetical protein